MGLVSKSFRLRCFLDIRMFFILKKYVKTNSLVDIASKVVDNPLKPFKLLIQEKKLLDLLENVLNSDREKIKRALDELHDDDDYWRRIEDCNNYLDSEGFEIGAMFDESDLIYSIVRLKNPDNVVEVGVANGYSTYVLLKALDANNKGNLMSVDKTVKKNDECAENWQSTVIPSHKEAGWVVPNELKTRWELIQGKIENNLEELSDKLNESPEIILYDADANQLEDTFKTLNENGGEIILIVDDYDSDAKRDLINKFVENRENMKIYPYNNVAVLRYR